MILLNKAYGRDLSFPSFLEMKLITDSQIPHGPTLGSSAGHSL